MYHGMTRRTAAAFRKSSSAQAMALLVKLDRWLAEQSPASDGATDPNEPLVRLGMGIHYFEESLDPSTNNKE